MDYRDIHRAIDKEEIGIALFPKIDCKSHQVVGFEALARWRRDDAVQIPTEKFIACFEKHGLIRALTNIVFGDAMQWLSDLDPGGRLTLCLNLSPLLLRERDFAESLYGYAELFGIDTHRIVLELTEHSIMNELDHAVSSINELRLRGFRIAIEDVGSRYGGLASLAKLPLSEMKIDRSFVQSISAYRESRVIIESMVALGHNLHLQVIAEGVENADADRFLTAVGCDVAQGYFYAPPMEPAIASSWLAQHGMRSVAKPP